MPCGRPVSHLQIFPTEAGHHPPQPLLSSNDPALIATELAARGIGFERWPARAELPPAAAPEQILAAFAPEIARTLPPDESDTSNIDIMVPNVAAASDGEPTGPPAVE